MPRGRILLFGLFLLLLCIAPLDLRAETATPHEMESVCRNWLAYIVEETGGWAGDPNPFIIEARDIVDDGLLLGRAYAIHPSGHVVVPLLKELPPIKAYSEHDGFNPAQTGGIPRLLKDVLRNRLDLFASTFGSLEATHPLPGQRMFTRNHREQWERFLSPEGWKSGQDPQPLTEVGPYLTSEWHQFEPYNNFCPMGEFELTLVGCAATAMAQLMNYHEWPPSGVGGHSFYWPGDWSCGGNGGEPGMLTADFSDPYDWANMPDDCEETSPQVEQDAVAEICYETAVSIEMHFGRCGSGPPDWLNDLPVVLTTNFLYEPECAWDYRADYAAEGWFELIRAEVNAVRPPIYCTYNHAVVCDGWRVAGGLMQYHMNYGWVGPANNTWYTVDQLISSPQVMAEYMMRGIMPPGRTVLVRADGTGDYPTLQAAIDAVPNGYVIKLEDGTYAGPGNRDLSFDGKTLVLRSLSGDPNLCVIDCENLSRGITLDGGPTQSVVVEGIQIVNGSASGPSPGDRGGAVYTNGPSVILRNCRITASQADGDGGGVCCDSAQVTVVRSVIEGNSSGGSGGGIRVSSGSVLYVTETTIAGNSSSGTRTDGRGGGLFCEVPTTLEKCVVFGNVSAAEGGGIYLSPGPGMDLQLRSCTVADNAAGTAGGGLYVASDTTLVIDHTILWDNCAVTAGDELYMAGSPVVEITISNVDSSGIDGTGTVDWRWYNTVLPPGFCDPRPCDLAPVSDGDYHLKDVSPCAPPHSASGLVGALGVACTRVVFTVRPDGTGDFPTIQVAVDSVPAYDIIELDDGIFAGSGNREIDFRGRSTIVRSTSGSASSCIIDCAGETRAFHFHSGEDAECVLMNVTVQNGDAPFGGAILCEGSSPILLGCVLRGNSADESGGAVLCRAGSVPLLDQCTLVNNSATHGAGIHASLSSPILENTIIAFSEAGESVSADSTGMLTLRCSDVYGNAGGDWVGPIAAQQDTLGNLSADPMFCDAAGGNFHLDSTSPCSDVAGCGRIGALGIGCYQYRVWRVPDDAPGVQAGIDSAAAGDTVIVASGTYGEHGIEMKSGIVLRSETGRACDVIIDASSGGRVMSVVDADSTTLIVGFTFTGGLAGGVWPGNAGGGIYCENGSPEITGCIFLDNSAAYGGGAACHRSETRFAQCTFVENSGVDDGGGVYVYRTSAILENCIVASSVAGQAVTCGYDGGADLVCCDVYGNAGGDWTGCLEGKEGVDGNFSDDPCFCEPFSGELAEYSPCAPENSPGGCGLVGALGIGCTTTAAPESVIEMPAVLSLAPNVPNPFNPVTQMTYSIPAGERPSRVSLSVYNCLGQRVRVLVDAIQPAGFYPVVWDGRDHRGSPVASGVYFSRLEWSGESRTRRMVLLK